MNSIVTSLLLVPAIMLVSCGKTDRAEIENWKSEPVLIAQVEGVMDKEAPPKSKPAPEPVPVDVAVERALKKMTPEQKKILSITPLTTKRYPAPPEPNFGPESGSMRFTDTDPGPTIGGILTMSPAIDQDGNRVDEAGTGITSYTIHWGLDVGAPGLDDDKGRGDHGGDCMMFRDPTPVFKAPPPATADLLSWDIPAGTVIPENAVYFVGQTQYDTIYNLKTCIQIPIENLIE